MSILYKRTAKVKQNHAELRRFKLACSVGEKLWRDGFSVERPTIKMKNSSDRTIPPFRRWRNPPQAWLAGQVV
jgi:hypothetical protein